MINLYYLALEVTRRCNELCAMCMRGQAENVDMTEEIVQQVLLDKTINKINTLCFSGGEPTINEYLVCYAIELIIKNKLPVQYISIITNAKHYPFDILEALSDYQKYCTLNNILTQYKSNVIINFSVDAFHENAHATITKYQKNYPNFQYGFKNIDRMWKTGKAKHGEELNYRILPLYLILCEKYVEILNSVYITAKGNYESLGDGSYKDMDKINMGSVFAKSFLDITREYGRITSNHEQIKKILY